MKHYDMLASLIQYLIEKLPGVWIGNGLPPDADLAKHQPCVVVDDLPSAPMRAWQGDVLSAEFNADIEVVGFNRASAYDLAVEVQKVLDAAVDDPSAPFMSANCGFFSTRPDKNPRVSCVGADASVMFR